MLTMVVMDSGPAPRGASRNDEWKEPRSIRLLRVGLRAGLHQIKAPLDLAEQASKLLALARGEASKNLLLPALQARDQLLIERLAPARQAQVEFTAVFFVLDALDDLPPHQRGDGAADGRFMQIGAVRDILRAAGAVAEAERRQHPPFRNVQPIALLIFARQRHADLGRQPVEAERRKPKEIKSRQGISNLSCAEPREGIRIVADATNLAKPLPPDQSQVQAHGAGQERGKNPVRLSPPSRSGSGRRE